MKRMFTWMVSLFLLGVAGMSSADAQMIRHSGGSDGDLVILEELGVVAGATEGSDDLEIVSLLPDAGGRSEASLKQGDLLLMIGGKRIRGVAELRAAYEGASIGETLKVGFRRGDERFLVSFEKEAKQDGGRRVVMMRGPGHGDLHPLMEFGVLLTESDGKVVVGLQMPSDQVALAKDDVIKSINGQAVGSLAAFREIYEATQVGDDLKLVYARDGKEQVLSRPRSDTGGAIRMRSHR